MISILLTFFLLSLATADGPAPADLRPPSLGDGVSRDALSDGRQLLAEILEASGAASWDGFTTAEVVAVDSWPHEAIAAGPWPGEPQRLRSLYALGTWGLKRFFESGDDKKITASHRKKVRLILTQMNIASGLRDMDAPGLRLHPLTGDLKGHWSVDVSGNWRITFTFDGQNFDDVDYTDYH